MDKQALLTSTVAAFLLTFLSTGPVWGHADYEEPLLTVQDRQGHALTVVRHYTDGIVATDLVKLVIYDPRGAVMAETDYYRDVVVYQAADDTLHVFGVGWFCVLFRDAWVLRDRELVPTHSAAAYGYALAAGLRTHWLGYGFSVLVCWAAAYASLRRARPEQRHWVRSGEWVWPVFWLFLVFAYEHLSVPLALVLAGLGLLPYLLWRGAFRWSKVVRA